MTAAPALNPRLAKVTNIPDPTDQQISGDGALPGLDRLCLISVTRSRYTGRIAMPKDADVRVKDADVNKEHATGNHWKVDIHPLFGDLDKNYQSIESTLRSYTVNDQLRGTYMVMMDRVPELLAKLADLRDQRMALAMRLQHVADTEWFPAVRDTHPDHFEQFIQPKLPNPGSVADRFGVSWNAYIIQQPHVDDFNLDSLSYRDRDRVMNDINRRLQDSMKDRAQAIMDTVFGELMELCDEIVDGGSLETGRKREGSMRDILSILDRVRNFDVFASPEILQRVQRARDIVSGVTHHQINASTLLQRSIKEAMSPIRQAVNDMRQVTGRDIRNTRSAAI